MKQSYRLHTIDNSGVLNISLLLPTDEKINDDRTTFIGPWVMLTKIDFFENGIYHHSISVFDINDPTFCAKVLYDGEERDALYRPLCKTHTGLAIIGMPKQPLNLIQNGRVVQSTV